MGNRETVDELHAVEAAVVGDEQVLQPITIPVE